MSKTPLTDVEEFLARRDHEGTLLRVVSSYFTRKLETDRAELADWLRVLADIPIQEFGWEKTPHQPLHAWNGYTIYAKDVLAARALLAKLEDKHG